MTVPNFESASGETPLNFERRKQDHIRLSLDPGMEALGGTGLDHVRLVHEALPELNFSEVTLQNVSLGWELPSPFLVSSMTAGHVDSLNLNLLLATACESRGWLMGVGSQRRELFDQEARREWRELRKVARGVRLLGNIGLSQLIECTTDQIEQLVDALEASAMIVHLNPLQECFQKEGTPHFAGGLKAIERLARQLSVPVVIKETGCGISEGTFKKLIGTGVRAVDVSGFGGTHWGRIEGGRGESQELRVKASETFKDWGIGTVQSLMMGCDLKTDYALWASGGVRSGLDAAKLLAIGAEVVGFAKPILAAALKGERALDEAMETFEFELKTALFCTGCQNVRQLKEKQVWQLVQK